MRRVREVVGTEEAGVGRTFATEEGCCTIFIWWRSCLVQIRLLGGSVESIAGVSFSDIVTIFSCCLRSFRVKARLVGGSDASTGASKACFRLLRSLVRGRLTIGLVE